MNKESSHVSSLAINNTSSKSDWKVIAIKPNRAMPLPSYFFPLKDVLHTLQIQCLPKSRTAMCRKFRSPFHNTMMMSHLHVISRLACPSL